MGAIVEQMNLFDRPNLNIISRLKATMREGTRKSRLSREQIVEQMTEIMRAEGLKCPGNSRAIGRATLDKWVSESSIHTIPVALLPVFCTVVDDYQPIQVLARALSLRVISGEDIKLLAWGRAEFEKRKISKKAKKLAEEIGL